MKMRRLCLVQSHSCVGRYVTGNNSDVLPLPSDLPFTSVGGSAFGNEPSTFGVLFGVFSFESDAREGLVPASGRQACIVHNQRTNFPALFTLNIAHGFSVAEYSETSRSEVNAVSKHNSTHTSHSLSRLYSWTTHLLSTGFRCNVAALMITLHACCCPAHTFMQIYLSAGDARLFMFSPL